MRREKNHTCGPRDVVDVPWAVFVRLPPRLPFVSRRLVVPSPSLLSSVAPAIHLASSGSQGWGRVLGHSSRLLVRDTPREQWFWVLGWWLCRSLWWFGVSSVVRP